MAKSTLESPAPTDRMSPSTLNPVEPPWYGPVCPVVWEGRHREVPPYPDMGAHPVQAVLLETIDRRLDGGMLMACQCEIPLRLVFAAAGGQAAYGGHGVEFQRVAEGGLVLRAVKAAVEAAREEFREAFPRGLDDGNSSIRVAPLLQDPVLEDELNWYWSSTIATGTPSSTGRPAFPLLIHRVCFSKTEKTFASRGITSPCRIIRSVWSIWRFVCAMYRSSSFSQAPRSSRLAKVASAFASSFSHLARNTSTFSRQASVRRVLATC